MFQATVLALCILSDSYKVHVIITRLIARDAEARPHVGVQLKLFPKGQIERPMALADRSRHGPFQPNAVLL